MFFANAMRDYIDLHSDQRLATFLLQEASSRFFPNARRVYILRICPDSAVFSCRKESTSFTPGSCAMPISMADELANAGKDYMDYSVQLRNRASGSLSVFVARSSPFFPRPNTCKDYMPFKPDVAGSNPALASRRGSSVGRARNVFALLPCWPRDSQSTEGWPRGQGTGLLNRRPEMGACVRIAHLPPVSSAISSEAEHLPYKQDVGISKFSSRTTPR